MSEVKVDDAAEQGKIRLIYFQGKGRAEPIRLTFVVGGVDFDDVRFTYKEWPKIKAEAPRGTVPVLEVVGRGRSNQSNAQLRFAGKLAKLYPQDPFDALRCDAALDDVEDLMSQMDPSMREKDIAKRLALRVPFAEEHIPSLNSYLNSIIKGPFLLGDEMCVADIKIASYLQNIVTGNLDGIPKDIAAKETKLNALSDAVFSHPRIVKWYADQEASANNVRRPSSRSA